MKRTDYENSSWARMLQEEDLRNPRSDAAKTFRLRFRVPYPMYVDLVELAESELGFKRDPTDVTGRKGIPLVIKMLAVLRVLGRGTCFDGIEELAFGDQETYRIFFHDFCKKFAAKFYDKWIYAPYRGRS